MVLMALPIPTWTLVLLIITVILLGVTIGLYFLGKRAEKKRAEQDEQIKATAQTVSMLIIDKKRLRIKDSGLPAEVIAQTPFYAKATKLPIVKAKVGPRTMNLICDAEIFDEIPVKKEVKAQVSGLYITSVKGLHGKNEKAEEKLGLRARMIKKLKSLRREETSK